MNTISLDAGAGSRTRALLRLLPMLLIFLVAAASAFGQAGPPTINSPGSTSSPGPIVSIQTPVFSWSSVSGATGYGLYIRDLTTNTLIFNNDGGPKTGTTFSLPSGYLAPGHSYRWAMTTFVNTTESNQSPYRFFQTGTSVNLVPYLVSGRSNIIGIGTGTFVIPANEPATITTNDSVYFVNTWANVGNWVSSGLYSVQLYLDGVLATTWSGVSVSNPGAYVEGSSFPGKLSAGSHTAVLVVDALNNIQESDEGDNQYSRTFTVVDSGSAPSISSVTPNPIAADPADGNQILTINGANFVNKPTVAVTWTGGGSTLSSAQVTYVSSTQLTMSIKLGAVADNWTVNVKNPDGQKSNTFGFQVVTTPVAPDGLGAQVFPDHVLLGWNDNSTNESGFKIERRTGSGSYAQIAVIGANSSNAAYYTDNTVSPQTSYSYRVRAYNAGGDSGYTTEVTLTTPEGPPGAFTLSNTSPVWDSSIPGPEVQLNWTASTDAGGYSVYRNGVIYSAGISGTSFLNSANLSPGATYTYFIRASNAAGTTDSNTITVTMPTAPQGPSVTSVNPNPVPGSNASQNFVVNGSNFDPNCTVTLRDLTTGITYANRTKIAQTGTSITLNPNFGTPAHIWSVEVINPGSVSSGPYQFLVSASASLVSLTVNGPSALTAGGQAAFTATAYFSSGSPQDVSNQVAWSVTGGPTGTHMSGRTLVAGSGPASTAAVSASYSQGTGIRSASASVSIGAGLSVAIQASAPSTSAGSSFYHLQANATPSGGSGTVTAVWKIDGTSVIGSSLGLDTTVIATQGTTHNLEVKVTDGAGLTAQANVDLLFPKTTQVNEQFPSDGSAGVPHAATLYAADGVNGFTFDDSLRNNGVIVIIHGLNDSVDSQWMQEMAAAIRNKLGPNAAPNILLYDWRQDATPLLNSSDLLNAAAKEMPEAFPPNSSLMKKIESISADAFYESGPVLVLLTQCIYIRPMGEAHGFTLADYLSKQIDAGHIDATKPIQLIGHSAGGFVAANAGLALLAERHPAQLQVTTLDTPFLRGTQVLFVKGNGGKFDRYVSSALGELVPGLELLKNMPSLEKMLLSLTGDGSDNGGQSDVADVITQDATYHIGADIDTAPTHWWQDLLPSQILINHQDAHEWYSRTIANPDHYGEGFYYSPFIGNPFPQSAAMQPLAMTPSPAPVAVTGFSSFGNVSNANEVYTLTEQGNAGIYENVTIPMNASTLKFNVQFTHPGDGDFVEVSFGDHPVLVNLPDGAALESGPIPIEIPIVYLGGETGQLLFKLNGIGADNAIVQLDSIAITTDDDADHDGLTYLQEIALGTDPRYPDTDGDGINDGDEVNIYHTNPLLADTDGDGIKDGDEVAAGTNPLDPTSNFKLVGGQRLPNGSFTVSWSAVVGKSYRILRSPTPAFASFDILAVDIEPSSTTATYTDSSVPPGTTAAFYKVLVE